MMAVSMQDFLQFLKLSCQVHESINHSDSVENADLIDYSSLIKNDLVHLLTEANRQCWKTDNCDKNASKHIECTSLISPTKAQSNPSADTHPLGSRLSTNLNDVINEGLLDSILPFICATNAVAQSNAKYGTHHICGLKAKTAGLQAKPLSPNVQSASPNHNAGSDKNAGDSTASSTPKERQSRKKPNQAIAHLSNHEVLIHVCDEVKGTSKDFSCAQKLLVTKMGYFADVTAGQRLEDMDISVHCDLQIFEWLMRWVKKDTLSEELWPFLDSTNVIPILVSAGFLLMEPLVVDCLAYCHANLNEIVKASANLSCLNESIISRLAAMFTNLELEMVNDKKERVTPRLWIKMIQSLCEPEPQALRGHYGSLCDLFRCDRCLKYVNESMATIIHCHPSSMYLNRFGQNISQHNRDLSWNLNGFIGCLYKELKSWRKVYWRLWGNCHYLYCATCEAYFPLYQMNWCLYHPEQAQFLGPVTESRMPGPTGRYTCCGQQAFRYETLPGPMGCQYREHTVQIFDEKDRAILKLAQVAGDSDCLYESAPHSLKANDINEPWWNGIILTPVKERPGLLPQIALDDARGRNYFKMCPQSSMSFDSSSETESSDNYRSNKLLKHFSTTSSDGCESDYSSPRQVKPRLGPTHTRRAKSSGRYWSGEISARSNQDNQRDFEERAMKQIVSMVRKKTGIPGQCDADNQSNGGVYIHLETEWREKHRQHKSRSNAIKS